MKLRAFVADPRFRRRPITHAARLGAFAALRLMDGPARFRVGGGGVRFRFDMQVCAQPGRLGAGAYILRELYEPAFTHLSRLLRPGDRAIDCGAGAGIYSLAMASLVGPGGRVLSVELNPELAETVRANADLNRFHQIEVFEGAIGREVDRIDVELSDSWGETSIVRGAGASDRAITVEAASIDALVRRYGYDRLDLLKLDVEGAEAIALLGAERTLRAHRPIIVFEVWDPLAPEARTVRRLLTERRYQVFAFTPGGGLEPYAWRAREMSAVALGPDRTGAAGVYAEAALTD